MIIKIKDNRCTLTKVVSTIKDYIAIKELISLNDYYDTEFQDFLNFIDATSDGLVDESRLIEDGDKYMFKISFDFKIDIEGEDKELALSIIREYFDIESMSIGTPEYQSIYKKINNLKTKYL